MEKKNKKNNSSHDCLMIGCVYKRTGQIWPSAVWNGANSVCVHCSICDGVIKIPFLQIAVVNNFVSLPVGGSKPLTGHGRVWLPEQRHEVQVQVRRWESLPVWMSCRWVNGFISLKEINYTKLLMIMKWNTNQNLVLTVTNANGVKLEAWIHEWILSLKSISNYIYELFS